MSLSQNEIDILAILQFAIATKAPDDSARAALARLLAQIPKPAEAVDTRPDAVRRKEFIEASKAPLPKMTLPPVVSDGERRAEFIEQQKRPFRPTSP
jgi:hypothetical protein